MYLNIEDIKKKFTNEKVMTATHLAWDPFYRFTVMTRAYYDPPRLTGTSKMPSNWDDAEMHENKTQIYIMVAGTGVLALGGEPGRSVLARRAAFGRAAQRRHDAARQSGRLGGDPAIRLAPGPARSRSDDDLRDVPHRNAELDAITARGLVTEARPGRRF